VVINLYATVNSLIEFLEYFIYIVFLSQTLFLIVIGFGLKKVMKPVTSNKFFDGVSVIIAAKDELENLTKYLKSWVGQDYPHFEIIIVNDRSIDGTGKYLDSLIYPNLKVFHVDNSESSGKKGALIRGIKEAKFEKLFFTDADCFPSSSSTLSKMVSGFKNERNIVLGGVPVVSGRGFIQNLIGFDNIYTNSQYLGLASIGIPYMGVGRNLLYTKSVFESVNGFENNKDLKFGDDDLFVNQAATKNNTAIVLDPEALVYSNGPFSFRSWIGQKTRHVKASPRYRLRDKILLGVWNGGQLLIPVFFFSLFIFPEFSFILFLLWGLRLVIQYFTLKKLFILYNQANLVRFLPILDIGYSFFLIYLGIKAIKQKNIKWK
jgi:biofilm PGA synthesis N-glycosyltransferase PgaC